MIGLVAVLGGVDGKSFFFESLAKSSGEVLVVFDEQNAHGWQPNWAFVRSMRKNRNNAAMKS